VKRLPPVGLTPFSVGDAGAALDGVVVVVVVVEVVEGACCPLVPHAVANAPIAINSEPLAMVTRRPTRPMFIVHASFVLSGRRASCDGERRAARWAQQAR
jgi:hypothetical protein